MKTIKFINKYKLFFITVVCAAVVLASCSSGDTQAFQPKQMLGSSEAPPVTTSGSGTLDGNYNSKTKEITLDLKWSLGNKDDTTTMGHIHKGAEGVSGPVVIPFTELPKGSTDQEFKFVSQPLTAEQEEDLKAGAYYVNIHSNTFPAGELRAQLLLK
ncbi:MAG: CHRD domain-containing protein [Ginsengibacter sp.]